MIQYCTDRLWSNVNSPYPSLLLLLLLVQLVDVGEGATVVMAPQHRVTVVAGTHDAVLS